MSSTSSNSGSTTARTKRKAAEAAMDAIQEMRKREEAFSQHGRHLATAEVLSSSSLCREGTFISGAAMTTVDVAVGAVVLCQKKLHCSCLASCPRRSWSTRFLSSHCIGTTWPNHRHFGIPSSFRHPRRRSRRRVGLLAWLAFIN
jgi:hypothetical protein